VEGEVIWINEAKEALQTERLRKQICGKYNNTGSADKKNHCRNFFPYQKLKFRVSFIQLKPILDIFSCGFSLFCGPQHSLKALLLLNVMCLLKYVLNFVQNVSYFNPN
jgi:hypothetical protein